MTLKTTSDLQKLLELFIIQIHEIQAVIISDSDGLIIAGEKRSDIDMEIVSVLTTIVNPILERIREEFSFKRFGSSSFDTEDCRLLFIPASDTIISIVIDPLASIDKITSYGLFLAEKTIQILDKKEGEKIQFVFPDFSSMKNSDRLKNQIYYDNMERVGKYKFKFIIIGDHEVGKTSILYKFVEGKDLTDYRPTIGVNILIHQINLFGNDITFYLWDIGAQKYFKRYRQMYYEGSQAAFIMFDLTNRESFKNVINWYGELIDFDIKNIPIIIIGNKKDLTDKIIVNHQDLLDLNNKLNNDKISYFETSAKTGENIDDAFNLMSLNYIQNLKNIEEKKLNQDLKKEIYKLLKLNKKLKISIINDNVFWNPVLQILCGIDLGKLMKKNANKYIFDLGLELENLSFKEDFDVNDSDVVTCIINVKNKKSVDLNWKDTLTKIITELRERTILMVGIRVSDQLTFSDIIEDIDIIDRAKQNKITVITFKIMFEYRIEIYNQLKNMLKTLSDLKKQ